MEQNTLTRYHYGVIKGTLQSRYYPFPAEQQTDMADHPFRQNDDYKYFKMRLEGRRKNEGGKPDSD
jgi:hypothetical protein